MLSTPPQTKDWSSVSMSSKLTSGVILGTVNKMMERFLEEMRSLPDFCKSSFRSIVKLDIQKKYLNKITIWTLKCSAKPNGPTANPLPQ